MRATYLAHHGVLGQKWGIRKYQNEDGSYTAQGEGRYHDTREPRPEIKIDPKKAYLIKTGMQWTALGIGVLSAVTMGSMAMRGMRADPSSVGREMTMYAINHLH